MAGRKLKIEQGSGNIFADLDLPDAEELLLKSQMVVELHRLITERKLTQVQASKLMGITQPDLSALLRGDLRGYSVERLMRMLTAFNRDIEIAVKPRTTRGRAGSITFNSGALQQETVSSSAISSVAYDPSARTLEVKFRNGSIYRYFEVPPTTYEALAKAPSKGTFYSTKIRDRFEFARL
jgi:predicted XRE-type DNA-binding protein